MHLSKTSLVVALATAAICAQWPDSSNPYTGPRVFAAMQALGKKVSDLREPGSRPHPEFSAGTDMIPEIKHIILCMMENHSYDNMWGTLDRPDSDGFKFNKRGEPIPNDVQMYYNGTVQKLYKQPLTCAGENSGATQNWNSTHYQYARGAMNGWVEGGGGEKPISMAYMTEDQLPWWFGMGKTFPIADRYFASCPGQTWCNRIFQLAGTSAGVVKTGANTTGLVPPNGTIYDLLSKFKISWLNYAFTFNSSTIVHELPDAVTKETASKIVPFDQLWKDMADDKLPAFSFLDYNGNFSMESPKNLVLGEALMYNITANLAASPAWKNTLIIFNFDEHGGFYDHHPMPPCLAPDGIPPTLPDGYLEYDGFWRCGMRVPTMIVAPFAKKNYVSHQLFDHTSVLSMLEHKYNLPAMTYRDANAHPMFDMIDFEALRSGRMNFPNYKALRIPKPGNTTKALACDPNNAGMIPPPGSQIVPPPNTWW